MTNPLNSQSSTRIGLLLARLPVGAFLLMAGIYKLQGGVSHFVQSNLGNVPSWSHDWGRQYLQAVPYLEVVIGSMLVLGFLGRLAGLIAALMVLSFTVAVSGWRPQGVPFTPNVIYIGLLLMIFFVGPGRYSLDGAMFGRKAKSAFQPRA